MCLGVRDSTLLLFFTTMNLLSNYSGNTYLCNISPVEATEGRRTGTAMSRGSKLAIPNWGPRQAMNQLCHALLMGTPDFCYGQGEYYLSVTGREYSAKIKSFSGIR